MDKAYELVGGSMTYELKIGDEVIYTGKHDPNEVFCEIKWCIEDLLSAMKHRDIELTDENIDKAIIAVDYLYGRSVEQGWEVMDILLSNFFDYEMLGLDF